MTLRLPLVPQPIRAIAVVAIGTVILYYSVVPAPGSETLQTGLFGLLAYSDWLHLIAYVSLGLALAYAFHHPIRPKWQSLLVVGIMAVGYGIAMELLQSGFVARTAAVDDMIVNASGVVIAVVIWWALCRFVQFYQVRRLTEFEVPVKR